MISKPIRFALRSTLIGGAIAGSCASILSAVVLLVEGRRFAGSAAAPINAVSQWWWDREALHQQQVDVRHTAVGYATHHMASVFWGLMLSAFLNRQPRLDGTARIAAASVATSAIACFVDFQMTPRRLTPGFEHRLPRTALAATYAAFAMGLALGCLAIRSSRQRKNSR